MKNNFYILFIILTISCFYGCFASKGGYTDIKSSQWTLDSLNGNKIVLVRAVTITFNEENGRISGYGGCNSYFGSYFTKDSNKVTFFEVGSTKMACDMLEIENEYFSSLKKADKFMMTNKNLYLYSSGKLVIVFKENE